MFKGVTFLESLDPAARPGQMESLEHQEVTIYKFIELMENGQT